MNCILWKGTINGSGYGVKSYKGKTEFVHRLVWKLKYGPIPKGKVICHECDVKRCIRIEHLTCATQRQNVHDAVKRGLIKEMKLDYSMIYTDSKILANVHLAKKYGLSQSRISQILKYFTCNQS